MRTAVWAPIAMLAMTTLDACGGHDLKTLTRADVAPIASGDAAGATFAGHYLVTSNQLYGCRCRVGTFDCDMGSNLKAMYVGPATSAFTSALDDGAPTTAPNQPSFAGLTSFQPSADGPR